MHGKVGMYFSNQAFLLLNNISIKILFEKAGMHKEKGSGLEPWPQRLIAPPPRLEEIGVSPADFQKDTVSG